MRMSSTTPDRWLGVGRSSLAESHEAGRAATAQALKSRAASLILVFCSEQHDLAALLAGIREESGKAPLIGCTTAGEIASDGPAEHGIVVLALGGSGFTVATSVALDASGDLRAAGATAAEGIASVLKRRHRVVMLLSDGLSGDQQEIVRGAYSAAGATVPLVGGCAGDDGRMRITHQLFGDEVLTNAVVGVALGSDAPFGIGVRHGWSRVGEPLLVTRSSGNRVYEIDDRPALDVYLDRLDAPPAVRTDPVAFSAWAQTHPLGLSRRMGEDQVRFVADADFGERSLGCIAEVPQGTLTWLMNGDSDSVLAATDAACVDALTALGGRPPLGLVAFDCVARKGVLGRDVRAEVERVRQHAGGAPMAGFYTYGEIARTSGVSGFHNQTLVVLAIG